MSADCHLPPPSGKGIATAYHHGYRIRILKVKMGFSLEPLPTMRRSLRCKSNQPANLLSDYDPYPRRHYSAGKPFRLLGALHLVFERQ